jgi:hypothetical protein
MNKKTIIALAILGGVSLFGYSIYYYFQRQVDLLKQFEYKIINFTLDTLSLDLIKGKLNVLFSSVADIEVTVTEFYLDFYFDGNRVGYLQDVSKFIIPAHGSTQIAFEYTLNPHLIFGSVGDIIAYTTKQKDAAISVRGYASMKSGFISATLPIIYDTTVKEIMSS